MALEMWQRNKLGAVLAISSSLILPTQIKAELYQLSEDGIELSLPLLQVYIILQLMLDFHSEGLHNLDLKV